VLNIRVVSPPGVTPALVAYLAGDPGVRNLVVLHGAAVAPAANADAEPTGVTADAEPTGVTADAEPTGVTADAVQFDVTRAAANVVLRHLRQLGLDRDGPISLSAVDAAITGPSRRMAWWQRDHSERAPVWELLHAGIAADATYPASFFVLLISAGLIGACGILTNSQILIVGAMVVGPEYSAIIAVALGIERGDGRSVARGLFVLLVGFTAAIAVTLAFALCIRAIGHTPKAYLHGLRPVSDLINSPNVFSVVVAVVAALVGVVSLTLSRTSALIGVFVSVTTIPAAADIAVSIAYQSYREARGSTVQLLLNVGLLIIVGALALRAQRLIWRRWTGESSD
jgi:uncharacterized hydrophobic protein (TIGR00271 family)